MDKNLRPGAAAAYKPVQKHKVTPVYQVDLTMRQKWASIQGANGLSTTPDIRKLIAKQGTNPQIIHIQTRASSEEATYAQGLVVLN